MFFSDVCKLKMHEPFQSLTKNITNSIVMAGDDTAHFTVQTDASDHAMTATLYQFWRACFILLENSFWEWTKTFSSEEGILPDGGSTGGIICWDITLSLFPIKDTFHSCLITSKLGKSRTRRWWGGTSIYDAAGMTSFIDPRNKMWLLLSCSCQLPNSSTKCCHNPFTTVSHIVLEIILVSPVNGDVSLKFF